MKKILAVTLIMSSLFMSSCSQPTPEFEVKLLEDNTYEIVTLKNGEKVKDLNIPDTIDGIKVTSIGYDAFKNFEKIENVTLPSNLKIIKPSAFYGCSSIKEITLPSSVEKLDYYSFAYCTSLTTFNFNEGLLSIGENAFQSCIELTNLDFPDSLVKIGMDAFLNCNKLYEFDASSMEEKIVAIDGWIIDAFRPNENLVIEEGIVGIAGSVFAGNVREVTLPNSLKYIGSYCFADSEILECVNFGSGLISIGEYAFRDCEELTEIHIPNNMPWYNVEIENIEASPFTCAYDVYYGEEIWSKLEIPEGVKEIQSYAFANLVTLTEIKFPSTIECIKETAFFNKPLLKVVEIPTLNDWLEIDFKDEYSNPLDESGLYVNDKLVTTVEFDKSNIEVKPYVFYGYDCLVKVILNDKITKINDGAFSGCINLDSINANNIKYIGNYAFRNTGFPGIDINDNIEYIGEGAFSYCENVRYVVIGENVKFIGRYAFDVLKNIESYTFMKKEGWYVTLDENATEGKPIDIKEEGYYLFVSSISGQDNPYFGYYWKNN